MKNEEVWKRRRYLPGEKGPRMVRQGEEYGIDDAWRYRTLLFQRESPGLHEYPNRFPRKMELTVKTII